MQWESLSFNQLVWRLMTSYGSYRSYYRSAGDKVNTCDIIQHSLIGLGMILVIVVASSMASAAVLAALVQTVLMIFGLPLLDGEIGKVAEIAQIVIAVLSCAALYAYVLEKLRERRLEKRERVDNGEMPEPQPSKAAKLISDCLESIHNKVCIEIDIDTLRGK